MSALKLYWRATKDIAAQGGIVMSNARMERLLARGGGRRRASGRRACVTDLTQRRLAVC